MNTLSLTTCPIFAALPDCQKQQVATLVTIVQRVHAAERVTDQLRAEAQAYAHLDGISYGSLKRKYYRWRDAGQDWRALINRNRLPRETNSLPPEFIQYFQELCLQNNRKSKPAWRKLIRAWRSGEPIPGYRPPPAADPLTGHPTGWSYTNLMRYAPTKFELTASRIGRSASRALGPQVLATRAGLQPGQIYMLDDMWHNFLVAVPGQPKPTRILSLHCLDYFSGCLFAHGHKPRIYDLDTGKRENISEKETIFLVAHVLQNIGYNAETGLTFVVEHGTAAIKQDLRDRLTAISDGKITFHDSGIVDKALARGLFAGAGRGNFQIKAALESLHNLIQNEVADTRHFPGQLGSNSRINRPDEVHGRAKYTEKILRIANALEAPITGQLNGKESPAGQLLAIPVLTYTEALDLLYKFYDLIINARTEHRLEGWEDCGHLISEVRLALDAPWMPADSLHRLPPPQRDTALALLEQTPGLTRARKLSPQEVWERRPKLTRLPAHVMPQIFGPALGVERKVQDNHTISFESQDLGPGRHTYPALATTPHGTQEPLRPRTKWLTYVNPLDPTRLYITDAKGRYTGYLTRDHRPCRADTEGLKNAAANAAKTEARLLDPVVQAASAELRKQTEIRRHNRATIKRTAERSESRRSAAKPDRRSTVRRRAAKVHDPFLG